MNVTRDVVKDLLTVYLSGEASPDTRALVDQWLRDDPTLARQVRDAGALHLPQPGALPPTSEKRTLDRTRRRLRGRSILLGIAIYVSTLPLSVAFGRDGFRGLLIDNWPERAVIIAIAAVLWVAYWMSARRLRATGI
jgi:anti-sigma factor RsiW